VIAILESKINRDIRLACSSACHPNIEIAAQKALIEAYQTFKWLSLLRIEEGEPDFASDFSLVTDYKFHTLMYEDEQFHSQLAFLRENLEESYATDFPKYNTGAPEKLIGPVLDKIDRAGLDVIAIDITAPDVKQVGLHAVRIFMPGLISLNSNFRHRSLGQKRLYAFPDLVAGRAPDIENVEIKELNPYPHPFP
ncbi:MAG: YcaO-like family protein, partial [Chloroflexota bacterium]